MILNVLMRKKKNELKPEIAWERNIKIKTGKNEKPQADTLRFFKFLNKERKFILENKNVLDLGCGTGRNANYWQNLETVW